MTNRIEGYIGCPEHGALFRLESEKATGEGVFQHVVVPLDGVDTGDGKVCPVCGLNLQRVPAPPEPDPE